MKTKLSLSIKALSLLLCMLMAFYAMPLNGFAASAENTAVADDTQVQSDSDILCEDVSKRDANTKYFLMRDGSYTAAVYNDPVHFVDAKGAWQQYDNTLRESNTLLPDSFREYSAASSDMDIRLSKKAKSNKMITLGDIDLSWGYANVNNSTAVVKDTAGNEVEYKNKELARMAVSNANGAVIYPEIYTDTDLEVYITTKGVKENIILRSQAAPNSFTLEYKTDGSLTPVQTDSRTVTLTDADGNAAYYISAPYMIDAQDNSSSALTLALTEVGNKKFTLTLTADSEWLSASDRAYPVTVDPAFRYEPDDAGETYETNAVMLDSVPANLVEGSENAYAKIGSKYTSFGVNAEIMTLTKHTLPSQITATDRIISAEIYLWHYAALGGRVECDIDMQINAYRITSNWTTEGFNNVLTANTLPEYDNTVLDIAIANELNVDSNDFDTCYENFDITEAAQGWLDGKFENHGVLFRADDPPSNDCFVTFITSRYGYSSVRPFFVYNYRDTKGLESYWSYYSFGAGRNGACYVNNFSGALVKTEPLFTSGGSRNPYSVTLVYNEAVAKQAGSTQYETHFNSYYSAGYGWMLDAQQCVRAVGDQELIDCGYDYIWLDSDGTEHYFKRNEPEEEDASWSESDVWVDEDGLSLTMTKDTQYIYITSESGYKLSFYLPSDGGDLRYATDSNNNTTTYNYTTYSGVTGRVLTSIESASERTTAFEYQTITSGGKTYAQLTKITDPADREYTFTYVSNYLNRITYPDATYTSFYYDSGHLDQINALKERIMITYTVNEHTGIYRVSHVDEYAWSSPDQQYYEGENSIEFEYQGSNVTTIKDAQGRETRYVFDNVGRATSVIAPDGSVANVTYTSPSALSNSAYTSSVMSNKLTDAAASPAYVNNLLADANMERADSYTGHDLSGGGYTPYSIDTSENYLGYKSLKLTNTTATTSDSVYRQTFDINDTTAEHLTVSAYVRTDNVQKTANGGGACFELVCYDADGNTIGTYYSTSPLTGTNEWHRRSYTFTIPDGTESVTVGFALHNATGTVWYDCAQAEYSKTASTLNLLEDSSFDSEGTWTYSNFTSADTQSGNGYIEIVGEGDKEKYAYQYINVGKAGVCFTLLAHAASNGVAYSEAEALLEAEICYADGSEETKEHKTSFNAFCAEEDQLIILNVKPGHSDKVVEKIGFRLVYSCNANEMNVFDVMISVDESGTTYSYDDDGNLESAADNADRNQSYSYNEVGEITEFTDEKDGTYKYVYNEQNKHRLDYMYSTVTNAGFSFTYDEHGNITGVNAGEYSEESSKINSLTSLGYGYTDDGEFRDSVTDERGLTTEYDIDLPTGLTNSITTPASILGLDKNLTTKYTYDEGNHNLLSAGLYSSDDPLTLISGVTYTYNNPVAQLKKITRSDGQAYNFTYDIWGRVTDIKVGNRLLSHSVYTKASNDTQLAYTEYGNGAKIYYTYDWLDRIVAQSTTDPENGGTPYVSYDYNSEGLVGRVTDNLAYNTTEYHYDLLGRLVSSNMSSGYIDRYAYSYSNSNELTKASAFLRDGTLAVGTEYTYDTAGRLTISKQGNNNKYYKVYYTYDILDRVTCERAVPLTLNDQKEEIINGTEYYTYYTYLTVGDNTTSFVSSVTYKTKAVGATAETTVGSVHYTYDRNGFISTVTERNALGTATKTESYTYDALGQLKTVTNGSNVTEYTYDTAGNILSKKVNGTTVGSYTYGNSQWKDLLTSYNGQTITYDGIGNPTSYLGATLTWDMGRRLTWYDNTEVAAGYTYNASGQRTSKTVNLVNTDFFYDDRGSLVALVSDYGTTLYFYPDADGSIGSFSYDGEQYYYFRNAQNDVIGITDKNGAFVAKYTYDEWGKILSITDGNGVDVSMYETHIANLNPFRYRSYFYDAETGFYWLNTRYYDPAIGRFINADSYASTGQGVVGHNMFSYCGNNSINMFDPNGQFFGWFGLGVIVGITLFLMGCDDSDNSNGAPRSDLATAPDLNVTISSPTSYNCYGNGIGKQICAVPTGYEEGDSTRKTFEAVKSDLGSENVRELESIDSPIGDDEFKVAMKCGDTDFHFIRLDSKGWYNKSGSNFNGFYVPQEAVELETWFSMWPDEYGNIHIGDTMYYDETIYFAVKIGWDEQ